MPISPYLLGLRRYIGHELVMMPAVSAVIHDDSGRVLMVFDVDGTWGVPGGAVDPGEASADAVVREVLEELAVDVVPERLLALYRKQMTYPNGDVVDYTSAAFRCRIVAGELAAADGEIVSWEWVEPAEVGRRGVPIPEHVLHAGYEGPTAF